ncbi:hypothetical protein [Vibrio neptunius]|uniref:Uncharacterized protein n=1 Tax=Vibrio neptunius TaxID=170651 RepID=A0ABS2ZY85_9VIBR|nr:hypothetical protein [Vibrio neptunius]MBN3492596.1 hypothetical protein [Vibrio neptunius]MBN3515093.1 hypothetical protein [Vibrio neptunius]MBN3548647.1 hypothetical protein [Vibrio neptunius]MBN3577221.1 hypothetical protein [Vibrio neptunius]MCH9870886.1 hypothetical protein [Vibrio neptunius]
MTEATIEQVNQVLTQANLATVRLITPSFELYDVINSIVDDRKFSEETNFERLRVLLKAGILTERDILESYNLDVEHMDLSYERCPLVKILAPLKRDGTLYLSGSETLYQLSWDLYLDHIKNIILLGGRVDHDRMLCSVFDGRGEFELFNYLMDNFHIQPETINFVAGMLVEQMDGSRGNASAQERAAFEKLIEKGIDINLPFSDDDDYHSFLGVVFCYDPDLFEQYLLQKPSQQIIAALPWEFTIGNEYFHTKHLQLVQKLIELGYQLPLDEIIELLEDEELDDYAKALAH